jgi:hypothetical protein
VDLKSEPYPKRRVDAMSGVMMLLTLAALIGAAWMRFGRSSPDPAGASVGADAPPLRLIDLQTSEPIVLLGLNQKVVWVVFWSAVAPSGRDCLRELEVASRRLRMHHQFALVPAAVEVDDPSAVRAAIKAADFKLPAYLAAPETRRKFGAENADPPLHVLFDIGGRILAMARGGSAPAIGRIAEEAEKRLEEVDPLGETRFASVIMSYP